MSDASFRFSLELTGKIWQVVLCERSGRILVEERIEDEQRINYHLFDINNRAPRRSFQIDEGDWWTNSLLLVYPYFVLEQYGDPNDPSTKSVIIYHLGESNLVGHIPQFQFEGIQNNELIGVDPKDGATKKNFLLEEMEDIETLPFKSPVYYQSGSESCQLVEEFLEIPSSGVGCEYFEEGDYIIICYYVRLGTKFDRWLKVIQNGLETYSEKVDQGLNGFASGSFFVLNDVLVFIENGKKLNGIEL